MLNKIRDTTKANDDEITNNILSLARTRPDIFGSNEEEVGKMVAASIEERKISGVNRPIAWDGVVSPIASGFIIKWLLSSSFPFLLACPIALMNQPK